MKEKLAEDGVTGAEEKELSPAEQRALRAEKRAAWRQARLKSLEQVRPTTFPSYILQSNQTFCFRTLFRRSWL